MLLFGLLLWPVKVEAGDPTLHWRVMKTPHFRIYFHQRTGRIALRLARIAEEAYDVLTVYTRHRPRELVHVIIYDNGDDANGSATVLPRNTITLFTAPPAAQGVLNDSDNWLRGLFYHEFLHILHMDTMSGLHLIVNALVGKTFAPNMLMPLWWLEGWAIFAESEFTGGGRNRSSFFEMYLRAAVLEKRFPRLDQVTNGPSFFPQGTIPYLYGSRFLLYIARRYGKRKLTAISQHIGKLLLPYATNLTAKKILRKKYDVLWKEWHQFLRKKYEKVERRVKRHPLTPAKMLTHRAEGVGASQYFSKYRILFYLNDKKRPPVLALYDKRRKKAPSWRRLFELNGEAHFHYRAAIERGVLSQVAVTRNLWYYNDLFLFDLHSRKPKRLTYGMRAHDPFLSVDGRRILFVRQKAGETSLWIYDLAKGRAIKIFQPPLHAVISSPRFSPDERFIVCSMWFLGGKRDIVLIDFQSKKMEKLTDDRAQDIEPTFSPDGKIVVYSSDVDGIYNLYAIELKTRRRWRLTNELFGAFAPSVAPDGRKLTYTRFSSRGFDLAEMPFLLPSKGYPLPLRIKRWPRPHYRTPLEDYPSHSYSPLSTLFPHNWFPVFSSDHLGQTFGMRLVGSDVLNFHQYEAYVWFGLASHRLSYSLSYRYTQLYPIFSIYHSFFTRNAPGVFFLNGEEKLHPERVIRAHFSFSLPFITYRSYQAFSVSYQAMDIRSLLGRISLSPEDIPPRYPKTGFLSGLSFSWSFNNTQQFNYSISDERGRFVWVTFSFRHPWLGSEAKIWELQANWSEYVPMPWAERHVLALRLLGATGETSWRTRSLYYLGGIDFQELISSLTTGQPVGSSYLRGYPPYQFSGTTYLLFKMEYRLPLFAIERGFSVAPIYLRRLHFALFSDMAYIFEKQFDPYDLKVSLGAEVRLEMQLGYYLNWLFRLGFARGLTQYGTNQFYLVLGIPF